MNWRLREVLALQMSSLPDIFSDEVTIGVLVPLVTDLLHDNVAQVRTAAVKVRSQLAWQRCG
jgi:hypothetical protein